MTNHPELPVDSAKEAFTACRCGSTEFEVTDTHSFVCTLDPDPVREFGERGFLLCTDEAFRSDPGDISIRCTECDAEAPSDLEVEFI